MKLDKALLKPGRYSLRREGDNAGDDGRMLHSISLEGGFNKVGDDGEIRVGCSIICGSHYARSYEAQDFWVTTPVLEILEVATDGSLVRFRTRNSIYTAKSF